VRRRRRRLPDGRDEAARRRSSRPNGRSCDLNGISDGRRAYAAGHEFVITRRLGAIVGPVLIGAFFLASCGADRRCATRVDDRPERGLDGVRRAPPGHDRAAEPTPGPSDGVVTTEQEYVGPAGDTPIGVANAFGVSLDDLVAYNEWPSANELPFPGTTIKIPPGGTAPAAQARREPTTHRDRDRPTRLRHRRRRSPMPATTARRAVHDRRG
jgi:hypothetical protein